MPLNIADRATQLDLRRLRAGWQGDCPAYGYQRSLAVFDSDKGNSRAYFAACCSPYVSAAVLGADPLVAPPRDPTEGFSDHDAIPWPLAALPDAVRNWRNAQHAARGPAISRQRRLALNDRAGSSNRTLRKLPPSPLNEAAYGIRGMRRVTAL
jgi:hypothetical protein